MISALSMPTFYPNSGNYASDSNYPRTGSYNYDNIAVQKPILEVLEENVRAFKLSSDESDNAFATRTGISQSTVDRVFKRSQNLSLQMLEQIAQKLGCEPWELLVEDRDQAVRALVRRRP